MENISPDFPRYGKLFSTLWKKSQRPEGAFPDL